MKLGSLFDGSGTCPLAASAVGIIPAWASEIEPFPKAVTQSRFPKMVHLGDITKMNGAEIEPVDVITFGSPCQNLSIAGNGKGLAGQESSLFFEAIRVIQEMRCATNGRFPQIVIWENVYGAFNVPLVLVPCFGQASYDEYAPTEQAVTLKATGGNYGGGTETLVLEPIGADFYNQAITGGVTMTLAAARPDHHHLPCALIPYTLKIRSGCEGGGKGALIQEDKSATLSCNNDQTLFVPTQTENGEVIYLARKLTPTECASLQGFEKDWCALVPHKDSAEYKMWGNGMAFPCMLYIMEGVQEVLAERYLDNLFGGDTTEP